MHLNTKMLSRHMRLKPLSLLFPQSDINAIHPRRSSELADRMDKYRSPTAFGKLLGWLCSSRRPRGCAHACAQSRRRNDDEYFHELAACESGSIPSSTSRHKRSPRSGSVQFENFSLSLWQSLCVILAI